MNDNPKQFAIDFTKALRNHPHQYGKWMINQYDGQMKAALPYLQQWWDIEIRQHTLSNGRVWPTGDMKFTPKQQPP